MGIQISESQFSTVQDNRGALFHFFLSKTATIYLKKHPTNCSWWILSVELYQYRFSETWRQKDSSKSKTPARSRVWDGEWKIPSKLVDFNIKSRQKKKIQGPGVKSHKSANFQNLESRNLFVYSIPSWFKIVQILARWSDRVESFFLPRFYHQDDRIQTDFRSGYPRKISRESFAPHDRCKFSF